MVVTIANRVEMAESCHTSGYNTQLDKMAFVKP